MRVTCIAKEVTSVPAAGVNDLAQVATTVILEDVAQTRWVKPHY